MVATELLNSSKNLYDSVYCSRVKYICEQFRVEQPFQGSAAAAAVVAQTLRIYSSWRCEKASRVPGCESEGDVVKV